MLNIIRFVFGSLLAFFASAVFAQAQTFTGYDQISKLFGQVPGAQFLPNAVGPGGMASAAGDILVKPSGLKIPMLVKASLPVGRMAAIGGACLSGGAIGPLGCVLTLASLAYEMKTHGVFGTCPDGSTDLFCKVTGEPSTGLDWKSSCMGQGVVSGSSVAAVADACGAQVSTYWRANGRPNCSVTVATARADGYILLNTVSCNTSTFQTSAVSSPSSCPVGKYLVGGMCSDSPGSVVATRQQVVDELNRIAAADYAANQRILQEMQKDVEAHGTVWPPELRPVRADDPVEVVAPPVTSPAQTTKVETIPNTDGTTSTRTTSETTKVSPTVSGSTVGTVKVDFPSSTTSTATTTNNTTNATTTQTTVVNNPVPTAEPKALTIPDDYNREVTQQKILTGEGGADMVEQGPLVDAAKAQGKTDLDALRSGAEVIDKSPWFSWVWTPPTGSCAPFAGTVHGYPMSFDLCPTIGNIRDVLGWLFAIFAGLEIYGQLFRREN